jgi:hypothetical protein
MDLASFLKFGVEADLEKRRLTINLGIVKISGIRLPTLKAMARNRGEIEEILSAFFVQRGIMWIEMRRECVDRSIEGLNDLKGRCEGKAAELRARGRDEDQMVCSVLLAWATECDEAARMLRYALEDEADPINSGMDVSARDAIAPALGNMRKKVYPFVELLIDLLPTESPVKQQATKRLREGKDILVRDYGVSVGELVRASLEDEAA